MKNPTIGPVLIAVVLGITGCASSAKNGTSTPAASSSASEESRIVGDIPAGSPFAKLQLGMTQGQVHEIAGQPNDTITYSTGKMWIPFYFGRDMMRLEEMYKGQGRITFTGAGVGGTNYKVYRIVYDANEDGHPDR